MHYIFLVIILASLLYKNIKNAYNQSLLACIIIICNDKMRANEKESNI